MKNKQGYALLSPKDNRDYRVGACMEVSGAEIPERFEVWQPPVENQGSTGNCVAQALANIMECIDHKEAKEHKDYSVGYIYGTQNLHGMIVRDACDAMVKEGDVYRWLWECLEENPACHNKRQAVTDDIKSAAKKVYEYVRLNTKEEVQRFILKYELPVLFVTEPCNLSGGTFSTGLHALVCYGWQPLSDSLYPWDPRDMLYQNSWGTGGVFGDGRGAVNYDKFLECWGIVPMEKKELTDIKGHWAEPYINDLVDAGLVDGYEDNTFKPENYIARGETAKLMSLLLDRIELLEKKVAELEA